MGSAARATEDVVGQPISLILDYGTFSEIEAVFDAAEQYDRRARRA